MKKIAILNFKGGVGKTTTSVNLGDALHLLGKKVLVVDIDAQRNTTLILDKDKEAGREGGTLYDAITSTPLQEPDVYEHTKGLDFIAGDTRLSNIESALANIKAVKEYLLKRVISNLEHNYDYVLFDCPPNNGLMTTMALSAADSLIIPIDSQVMALDGLSDITSTYSQVVENGLNDNLAIEGFLMTRYRATLTTAKTVYNTLRDMFPGKVFNAKIRENTTVGQAPGARMTIFEYDNKCAGAEDYMQLAKELIKKK